MRHYPTSPITGLGTFAPDFQIHRSHKYISRDCQPVTIYYLKCFSGTSLALRYSSVKITTLYPRPLAIPYLRPSRSRCQPLKLPEIGGIFKIGTDTLRNTSCENLIQPHADEKHPDLLRDTGWTLLRRFADRIVCYLFRPFCSLNAPITFLTKS